MEYTSSNNLTTTNPDDFNIKDLDFVYWLIKNNTILNPHHIPRVRHISYIEQIINGIGIQTDQELFDQYLDVWRRSGRLKAAYDKDLDCIAYFIDDILCFRKYDFGCIY